MQQSIPTQIATASRKAKESLMGVYISFAEIILSAIRTARLSRQIGIHSAALVEMARRKRNAPRSAKLVQLTLPDFPSPIYFRSGTCDLDVFWQVILKAEYDIRSFPQFQAIDSLYLNAKANGHRPVIIDCGANIGLSAIWFSRLFPDALILAVEPSPDNIEIARLNVRAYPNVMLLHGAVWDHPTALTISDAKVDPWAYQTVEAQDGVGRNSDNISNVFTIPELIDKAGAHQALIVKIDIEGAEAALFRSNTEWVGHTALIVIELHDWMFPRQRTSAPFIRSLANLDFDLLQRGETLFVFIDEPGT